MKSFKKKRIHTQGSFHVKRGDQVYVLSGKDAGKAGLVRSVNRQLSKALVEGVNQVNGKERLIHVSNLKLMKGEVAV